MNTQQTLHTFKEDYAELIELSMMSNRSLARISWLGFLQYNGVYKWGSIFHCVNCEDLEGEKNP